MNEQLQKALKEYNDRQDVSALEIAIKYDIKVTDLHNAYAKLRAQQ